jgi:hypothetical protein
MATREEHLALCKERAIALLEAGDMRGAIGSMISDIKKSELALYDPDRDWIRRFN